MDKNDFFSDSIPFLSFQERRILREHEQDLKLWQGKRLEDLWPQNFVPENKAQAKQAYERTVNKINEIRRMPIDYSDFNPDFKWNSGHTEIVDDFTAPDRIMGRCPCPDESDTLRCCNLKTLDAVQQCGFACAYCSIQSFYSKNQIKVVSNLQEHLENMALPEEVWHIGTGQSSDSLLLGDDYGTLTALKSFAEKHQDVIVELKTKSSRTDWLNNDFPCNIIATWSVNADTVAAKEEHLAAGIKSRISAAKTCMEHGCLIGFHIHPMVRFSNWKTEYKDLVNMICDNIDPDMVVMTGMGTLTFTKQNLKTLRESGRPTRVTHIPFESIAGKYSYPIEMKKEMFSYVYSCFPQTWKDKVFFYLCMEAQELWKPCLGREYKSNSEFEADMKARYFAKVQSLADKRH